MAATADPTAGDSIGGLELAGEQEHLSTNGHAELAQPDEMLAVSEAAVEEQAERHLQPAGTLRPGRAPLGPILALKRPVKGRYRGTLGGYQAELRVDVDGPRPMMRVSGDFFSVSGGTTTYYGSFVVDAVTVTRTATQVVVQGQGRFTFAAGNTMVRVTCPRSAMLKPQGAATLEFLTPQGQSAVTYQLPFESQHFRTVQLETDSVAGTVPFVSYDTATLAGPDPDRVLTVPKAYQEAGIDIQVAGTPNVIPGGTAGATWSDSELHAAMVSHFSLYADRPQWKVWMFVATGYDDSSVRGIMFDASGARQRQGAAVFWDAIGGADAASQRAALRTYVHELGHAFNLLHSWQKHLAVPPQPLGLNGGRGELSWMNYVQGYDPGGGQPSGTAAYWAAFPFQFVDAELVHLRHGFRNDVIPGGSNFGAGAAEVDPQLFAERVADQSGLALELRSKGVFGYGEPVVVELKLAATDTRGTAAHTRLHPKDDMVSIAVRQPSGRCVRFRPLMRHCVDDDHRVVLSPETGAIYDSAYIGFGADGFLFEQPGAYELRAEYVAGDGSRIVSDVARLRVRHPVTAGDQHAGELLMGEDQGQLLAVLGSDSSMLAGGNAAFEELLERYPDHELATYARMARGMNLLRDFKQLPADKSGVDVRAAQPEEGAKCLAAVERTSVEDPSKGVDNITLNMVIESRARAEAAQGNTERAGAILDAMPGVFEQRGVRATVVETVRAQADALKADLGSGG